MAAAAGRPLVLVVEDDASLRLLCRVNLELEEFEVREAATMEDARAEVARERPDVVFLDMCLNGRSTDDLLAELGSAGIPVVVVTGTDTSQFRDRASSVIGKPFKPGDLVAAARRHTVG